MFIDMVGWFYFCFQFYFYFYFYFHFYFFYYYYLSFFLRYRPCFYPFLPLFTSQTFTSVHLSPISTAGLISLFVDSYILIDTCKNTKHRTYLQMPMQSIGAETASQQAGRMQPHAVSCAFSLPISTSSPRAAKKWVEGSCAFRLRCAMC